jgi:4-amino-4-deoxy-L-arabinose transferase-like glycosyltransferase
MMNEAILPRRQILFLDLACLAAISIFLGFYGGTPFYHPDAVTSTALQMLSSGGNPQFFHYPALVLDLNAIVYKIWLMFMGSTGIRLGTVSSLDWLLSAVHVPNQTAVPVFGPGHIITLFFSLLGVASTYLASYRLVHKRWVAWAAALILATSLLWVTDAHFETVDTPLAGLGIATIALTLLFTGQQRRLAIWQVITLGIFAGLTASAKYNGALVLIGIAAATYFDTPSRMLWLKQLFILGATAAATFLITNPFIPLDFRTFWGDFSFELQHAQLGHPGYTNSQAWLFHLQTTLPLGIGWLAMILAVIGGGWLAFSRSHSLSHKLSLMIYPVIAFVLVGSSHLAFQRYMLPILPFLAVLAALALFALVSKIQGRSPHYRTAAILVAVVLFLATMLPNLHNSLQSDYLLARMDTRIAFLKIINKTGLSRSAINGYAGEYTERYFDSNRFKTTQANADQASIFILDSFSNDRCILESSTCATLYRKTMDNGYSVIQLTPYILSKEQVPFSVQSIYSPYLPDLYARKAAGPFIEIYLKDASLIQAVLDTCQAFRYECLLHPASQGYYYKIEMK